MASAGVGALAHTLSACTTVTEDYSATLKDSQGNAVEITKRYKSLGKALHALQQEHSEFQLSVGVFNYADQNTYVFTPEYRGYEASTVKVPLALTAMRQVFEQGNTLDSSVSENIKVSVGLSDNDATKAVFGSLGSDDESRAAEMNKTYDKLGISATRANAGWGANLTSANDHLYIARAIYEGLDWVSEVDMQLLRDAMTASDPASQGWGIGVLAKLDGAGADSTDLDAASHVLCKNGWLPDDLQKWYINSDGVVAYGEHTLAISVMSSGMQQQEDGQHFTSR
ncbi:MAG: hypothetical protein Q3974_07075, partial [Rothia sp. (in: high G+C Gram-positive bacteria)]|nr:hypothetical protein [Rothia sp. (in: high G+C Gram-positive bacteria)]